LNYGETPYDFLTSNREVMEYVCEGKRLPKLFQCSDELYQLMVMCWKADPSERPSFKETLEFLVGIRGEDKRECESLSQGSEYYKNAGVDEYNRETLDYMESNLPEYQHTPSNETPNYNQTV
jgi:hypothetical protein